jgi:hypothetical protein
MWSSVIIGGLLPKSDSPPELHFASRAELADPVLIV